MFFPCADKLWHESAEVRLCSEVGPTRSCDIFIPLDRPQRHHMMDKLAEEAAGHAHPEECLDRGNFFSLIRTSRPPNVSPFNYITCSASLNNNADD